MKSKLSCTKEVSWEMAHRLSFHQGLCKNLHGHTYKLQATFEVNKLYNGMIADFGDLKKILQKAVVERLDHTCWLNGKTDDTHIGTALKDLGLKLFYGNYEPTAENMVQQIAEWIEDELRDSNAVLTELRLYETSTSWVTLRRI